MWKEGDQEAGGHCNNLVTHACWPCRQCLSKKGVESVDGWILTSGWTRHIYKTHRLCDRRRRCVCTEKGEWTHDTECISESSDEDTAHTDLMMICFSSADSARRRSGKVGGNKNMNNYLEGKLFRSSKQQGRGRKEGICVIFRSGNGCQKCPPPLPGPFSCLGNLLQCCSRHQGAGTQWCVKI